MTAKLLPLALCLFALPSCLTIRERMVDVDHPVITAESGVTYQDLLVGTGELVPEDGMTATIDYVCTLEDETLIDSTHERGQPVRFLVGEAWLPGIDDGISNMRVGGKRHVVLPPEQAYGSEGVPGLVPPDASLHFELELVSLE